MNKVYLLLGGNLSDPFQQLLIARKKIAGVANVILESSIYKTKAWGKTDQPDFLNQVLLIETPLGAEDTLQQMLAIENSMGRVRSQKNAPRLIDIDILFYNSEIVHKKNLSIPHPSIAERRFVLVPLSEIAPDHIHPVSGLSIAELLRDCEDTLQVKRY